MLQIFQAEERTSTSHQSGARLCKLFLVLKSLWCKRRAPKGFFVRLLVYSEGSAESTDPWCEAPAVAGVTEFYLSGTDRPATRRRLGSGAYTTKPTSWTWNIQRGQVVQWNPALRGVELFEVFFWETGSDLENKLHAVGCNLCRNPPPSSWGLGGEAEVIVNRNYDHKIFLLCHKVGISWS